MQQKMFSYDDVYLKPKYSELNSRNDADTSVTFLGHKFRLPVIPARRDGSCRTQEHDLGTYVQRC